MTEYERCDKCGSYLFRKKGKKICPNCSNPDEDKSSDIPPEGLTYLD